MARAFVAASTQYLEYSGAIVNGLPVTMACWFYINDINVGYLLMAISDTTGADEYVFMSAQGDVAGDYIRAQTQGAGSPGAFAASTAGYSASTWHHGCSVFTNVSSRIAYLDGGNSSEETTTVQAMTNQNVTDIGVLHRSTFSGYLDGRIAEAAIWNTDLTAAEAAILATGMSPLVVRPQSLVGYWPLIGRTSPEIDIVGGYDMALVAAPTVASHPPVIYPASPMMVHTLASWSTLFESGLLRGALRGVLRGV